MRSDVFWAAVWGACFVGGVFIGSTGMMSSGVVVPAYQLRGAQHSEAASTQHYSVMQAAQALSFKNAPNKDNKAQIVGNEEGSAAGAPPDRVLLDTDEVASGPRHFSSKIEEIRDLNGGLWGPNEEEELEIKNELAYDDKMFEPKNNLYDFFLGLDADSLFEDEDDDISFSFSFDFDFDFQ